MKLSALHRALIATALLIVVITASTVLSAQGLAIEAVRFDGMRDILALVLLDALGATALSRAGRTSIWSRRTESAETPAARRPPPPLPPTQSKRDRVTPMDRQIDDMLAQRRYVEAELLARDLGDPAAIERVRDAREAEQRAARRHADDTRGGRRKP